MLFTAHLIADLLRRLLVCCPGVSVASLGELSTVTIRDPSPESGVRELLAEKNCSIVGLSPSTCVSVK